MLQSGIRQFVSWSSCKTLDDMIARAREREIDIEMERKRKPEVASGTGSSGKKSPRCHIKGPRDRRATVGVASVGDCTMGRARQGVPAASSAARPGT